MTNLGSSCECSGSSMSSASGSRKTVLASSKPMLCLIRLRRAFLISHVNRSTIWVSALAGRLSGHRVVLAAAALAILSGCEGRAVPADSTAVSYGGNQPAISAEVRANDAPPQIQAVWISGKTFKGGDLVRIRVTASTNVAVVEMRTFYGGRALIKHDFGKFGCAYHVPVLPPFARFPYTIALHFIARNSVGAPVEEDVAIDIRG